MKKKTIYLVIGTICVMILFGIFYWFHAKEKNNAEAEDTRILIETKTSLEHSSEGAQLTGIYSNDHELQYLYVDIYGTLGNVKLDYTFMEDKIIYSYNEVVYEQPFYIDNSLKIADVNRKKYVMNEKEMYDITDAENVIKMDEDERLKEMESIQDFINELSAEEE